MAVTGEETETGMFHILSFTHKKGLLNVVQLILIWESYYILEIEKNILITVIGFSEMSCFFS